MKNASPILLDRMAAALAVHGTTLKRHQLLQVAAAAFGHYDANAFSQEAKAGRLDAPAATHLGTIAVDGVDGGMALLTDPVAGLRYAVDPSALAKGSRAETYGVSPYGNLLALPDADGPSPTTVRNPSTKTGGIPVHIAVIDHRHGPDVHAAASRAELEVLVGQYCAESWDEARELDGTLPTTVDGLDDARIIELYFGAVNRETIDWTVTEIGDAQPSSERTRDAPVERVVETDTSEAPTTLTVILPSAIPGSTVPAATFSVKFTDIDREMAAELINGKGGITSRAGIRITKSREGHVTAEADEAVHGCAAEPAAWIAAMRDLLMPLAGARRRMAEFVPEAWVRDNAATVDAEGETWFDVTFELLLMGEAAAAALTSANSDFLKDAVRAPEWIRNWSGPYTIRVAEAD